MKKLSLLLVFVVLLVAMLAFNAFALDTRKVTKNDVTMSEGQNILMDGNKTCQTGDIYGWTGHEWYGGGGTLTITFNNGPVTITNVKIYAVANDTTFRVTFYDSQDNALDLNGKNNTARVPGFDTTYSPNLYSDANGIAGVSKVVIENTQGNKYRRVSEVEITAHFHNFNSTPTVITEATCVQTGEQGQFCGCGAVINVESIPATGVHNYVGVETKPATYDEDGLMTYTCSMCQGSYTEKIPMLSHNWDEGVVVAPTCTEAGYILKSCIDPDCDETEKIANDTPALGHNYDSGVITVNPTLYEAGKRVLTCQREDCKITKEVEVAQLTYDDTKVTLTQSNVIDYVENIVNPNKASSNRSVLGIFDGIKTGGGQSDNSAKGGWFAPSGSSVSIVLDEEYYVLNVNLYVWSNHNNLKIEFISADGTVKTYNNGALSCLDGSATKITFDVGTLVKEIKITSVSAKGDSGNCLVVHELEVDVHGHACEENQTRYNEVDPTCEEYGSYNKYCYTCEQEVLVETPALGHTELTPATCTVAAVCETCGESYGDKLPHTGGEATCTAKAICSECLQEYGELKEHVYGTAVCLANTCVNCGYVNSEITADAHTYGWNIGTDENGNQKHGCSVCLTEAVRDADNNKVSSNLGFTIYYADSWSDINSNTSKYNIIRLTQDSTATSYAQVRNANLLIDLGGHKITTSLSNASFYLYDANGIVNGTLEHNGGRQGLWIQNAQFVEDINIVMGGTYDNNATAVYVKTSLGYMKNVTIDSKRDIDGNLKDGIGLFNHGLEFSSESSTIGTLENVKVYSRGQAITIMAKQIGTMTNCVFSGDNVGMYIGKIQCSINLVNCTVSSKELAVFVKEGTASENNPISFTFDENTSFSSNNIAFEIRTTGDYYDFDALTSAVALVDGRIYTSFEEAFAALKASTADITKFNLIGDRELDAPIVIDKAVQFSLGGGTFKLPVIGRKEFTTEDAPGYTLTALNGAFVVKEGGSLTITGDRGTLVGNENAIVVEDGGSALIVAGKYVGYNPKNFLEPGSCYSHNEEKDEYTLTSNHTYDNEVLYGTLYRADGDCNSCGYVRGVARVRELYYATIEEAIAAAVAYNATVEKDEDKVSVELAVNIDLEKSLVVSDVVTITLNGKTISASKDTAGDGVFHVIAGGELTISDHTQYFTGTVNGVCASEYDMAIWADGGKVIIKAGIFTNEGAGEDAQYDLIYVKNGGIVEITGGTFKAQTPKWTINICDKTGGTVEVTGGTFPAGFNPGATETEPAGANNDFIPVEYYLNGDNKVVKCTEHIATELTCTEDSVCELCQKVLEEAPGHTEEIDKAVAPTCTETGLTEGSHCSVCGTVFVAQETVDALGHNYVAGEQAEDGSVTYTCSNDPTHAYVINNSFFNGVTYILDMSTPATSPLFVFENGVLTITDPMGNVNKYAFEFNVTTKTLTFTDANLPIEYLPNMMGVYSLVYNRSVALVEYVPPMDLVIGENTITLGSSGVAGVVFVATEDGVYTITISDGSEVLDENLYPITLPEKITLTKGQSLTFYVASRDVDEATVTVHKHSYEAVVTEPTCTDKGYTTYTCSCGDSYRADEVDALGHTEETIPAVDATCTTAGSTAGVKCSVCNEVLTAPETVDALGHTEVTIPAVPATCTEAGSTAGVKCSVCNEVLTAPETVDALGHTEVEIAPIPSYKDANKNVIAGMSSGVKCSVCTTVIKQPVVVNKFYVQGNRLSLSDYVNVDYGLVVPKNYTNVYVVYVSDANIDSDSVVVEYDGSGISTYRGIRMQNLGDNIHATMYATTPEGLTAVFVQAEYSVRTYCVNQLAKDSNGAEFKTMISDLIEAGAIAQQIKKYKVDQLVNKGADIEGLLTPSTNTTISGEKIDASVVYNSELNQKANITNKNLSVGNAMAVQFLLTIKSDVLANVRLEVVVDRSAQKLSNLTYTYSMAEENIEVYNASKSQYIVKVPDLRVIEYDAPIIATIYVGDEAVQQQTYSVNTYFENNYAKTTVDATMRKFLLAMYNYGMSAAAYKNA